MIGYLVSRIVLGDETAAEFRILPAEVMMPFKSPLRGLSSVAESPFVAAVVSGAVMRLFHWHHLCRNV